MRMYIFVAAISLSASAYAAGAASPMPVSVPSGTGGTTNIPVPAGGAYIGETGPQDLQMETQDNIEKEHAMEMAHKKTHKHNPESAAPEN